MNDLDSLKFFREEMGKAKKKLDMARRRGDVSASAHLRKRIAHYENAVAALRRVLDDDSRKVSSQR